MPESGVHNRSTGGADRALNGWSPPWVASLGLPVWIVGPDKTISYVNAQAAELIGRDAADCLGTSCRQLIAGRDHDGLPFCGHNCEIMRLAETRSEISPVKVRIRPPGGVAHDVQLLVIPTTAPEGSGPWLVHCVLNDDRARRLERYLTKVMSRSGEGSCCKQPLELTRRETEILARLAEDDNVRSIASSLCLSEVTVRNHVQHILNKLGVHSIMEAVACWLLSRD